jgi:hypothetical protein
VKLDARCRSDTRALVDERVDEMVEIGLPARGEVRVEEAVKAATPLTVALKMSFAH